jgi:TonB family protein
MLPADVCPKVGFAEITADLLEARLWIVGVWHSYLSPMILKASECWRKSTEETAHTPSPSAKQGQLRVQMRIERGGSVADAEIVSPSGDSVLDQDARECLGSLKMDGALPPDFRGKELVVSM